MPSSGALGLGLNPEVCITESRTESTLQDRQQGDMTPQITGLGPQVLDFALKSQPAFGNGLQLGFAVNFNKGWSLDLSLTSNQDESDC